MGGYELGDYENRLIAAIYEAALDSTKWRAVLAEVCQFIDADEGSLLFYDQQHSQRNFTITAHNTNKDYFVAQYLDSDVVKIKKIFSNSIENILRLSIQSGHQSLRLIDASNFKLNEILKSFNILSCTPFRCIYSNIIGPQ